MSSSARSIAPVMPFARSVRSNSAPIAYIFEDTESRFVSANAAAIKLLGLDPARVRGTLGLSLLPFMLGVGLLFFKGRSVLGWLLLIAGLTIIAAGIISNLHIYFRPTSLFNTLVMLGLLSAGIGLIARSLRTLPAPPANSE